MSREVSLGKLAGVAVLLIALVVLGPASLAAEEPSETPPLVLAASNVPPNPAPPPCAECGWDSELTFFGWITGVNGHFSVGPVQIPVVYEYNQILQRDEFGIVGCYETRKDQLGFYVDAIYAKWQDHLVLPGCSPWTTRRRRLSGLRHALWPWGPQSPWDLILGARFSAFHANYMTLFRNGAEGQSWWDPVFGVRYSKCLGDGPWQFSVRGEWGGTDSSSTAGDAGPL